MPRIPRTLRLLAEIALIVLLAQWAARSAPGWLEPALGDWPSWLVEGSVLVLLAGPLLLWRLRSRQPDQAGPGAGERPGTRGGLFAATFATLALGGAVTYLAQNAARERVSIEARAKFDRLAERLALETERRVNQPVYGLKGARGVYAASKSVERLEFRAYVASRDLPQEFPGLLGFGFVELVPRAELEAFEARERADDAPDFRVHGTGDAAELYVAKFVEPLERNRAAWGSDFGSDPIQREALERARRTGEPTLTPPIDLLQARSKGPGFLYFVPLYRKGANLQTDADRTASFVGAVFAPLLLEGLLAGARDAAEGELDVEIFDGAGIDPEHLLYDWDGKYADVGRPEIERDYAQRLFRDLRRIRVGGRTWTLALSSTPKFEAASASDAPALIALAGALVSLLLSYVIWSLGAGRERALWMAQQMTAGLASAKQAAEAALRDFDALRSTLDEHSIVSVADARGRILDVNKAFCRASGYAREELIGQDHRLLKSGQHAKGLWSEAWRTISSGKAWRAELCNRSKSGALYWVDAVIAPFVSAEGRVERYFSISTDITARKQAEAEQAAALALATALARSGDAREAARAVNDALGETTSLSRTAVLLYEQDGVCRFAGWRGLSMEYRRAVEGRCPWAQGLADAHPQVVHDALSEGTLFSQRELFRREGIASLAYVPILTAKGVIGYLMLYGSKPGAITPARVQAARSAAAALGSAVARLRMAEELTTNEKRFRSLVEGTEVIVWEFDALAGAFTYVSPQAARLGYPLEAWLAPGFWQSHLHPEDREWAVDYCMTEAQARRNHRFQYRMFAADGRVVWVEDFVSIEKAAGGELLLRGVMIDITESKRVAADLMEARAKAEAATRAKSEFLANMSHEIRTPLTAILGYSDLLREDGDLLKAPERRLQAIDTICGAGNYLLTVINDVLDLSKIEAGKMTVERVETPLFKILLEVADLVRPRAAAKGVELRVELDSPLPERVFADPTRLRQILMNLVGNAAKFTDQGHVWIRAGEEQLEGQPRLRIDVDDSGPGLEPEIASRLFVAFSQADASVTRKHGGTGLGLAICRRLAELMGGTVTLARSAPGQGCCFRLELPLDPAPGARSIEQLDALSTAAQPKALLPAARLPGRILVAEDGRDNQRLISLHLSRAGAEVALADNGHAALELLARAEAEGRPFGLLLTDIQMPEMDGYTLARTLRERGSRLAIVALTAHAMAEDKQRCLESGCDDYCTKPIDRNALLETCTRWLGRPSASRIAT